jgi:hypothetical protein
LEASQIGKWSAAALVAALVAFGLLLGVCAAYADGKPTCEVCHSQIAVDFHASIHAQAGLTCVRCHGGDPNDPTIMAMSAGKGFRGKPSRHDVPIFCASCHADRAMMHQYGLDTHQFEDYQTSMHGKQWLKGNTDVAVCVDCHGQHRILPPGDPTSTVYPMNVAKTCSRCHADQALMSKYGLPSDVYQQYETSVHAHVLASGGRQEAPTCSTCHGSHTALPPGAADIPSICGRCHAQEKQLIESSPHRAAIAAGAMSCISCHGHHGILAPTDKLFVTACGSCHARSSAAANLGDSLYNLVSTSRAKHDWAAGAIKALDREGVNTQDLQGQLEEADTGMVKATQDQHSLDPQKVGQTLVVCDAAVDAIQRAERDLQATLLVRRVFLLPFWAFLGLTILFLYWKRTRSEKGDRS